MKKNRLRALVFVLAVGVAGLGRAAPAENNVPGAPSTKGKPAAKATDARQKPKAQKRAQADAQTLPARQLGLGCSNGEGN